MNRGKLQKIVPFKQKHEYDELRSGALSDGGLRQPRSRHNHGGMRSHVKQAEARQATFFQQPFVNVLLLQLLDLSRSHLAAVGGEVGVGFGAHYNDVFIGSPNQERRKEFFFQERQSTR